MATHSSVLAWRVPGTGKPGGLPSMGSLRVRHDWSDLAAADCLLVVFMIFFAVQSWKVWLGLCYLFLLLFLLPRETDLKKNIGMIYVNVLPMFPSRSCMMSYLTIKCLSHFGLFCVYSVRVCYIFHWFTWGCPTFPTPLAKETLFSTLYILASFVKE